MRYVLATTFALSLLMAAPQISAEDATQPKASSYETPEVKADPEPFRIIILGTRKASDIELIRKNVEKLPYVSLFVPSSVSQRHLEFKGKYAADQETLIADIESLSQDRYEVKSKNDRRKGLVITVRKIQPVESSAE